MTEEKADSGIKMDYNYLGKTCGLKVSNLCLGTMTFGENKAWPMPGNCDEELSHQIMDRFEEVGGNFIDTANIYSNGLSEEYVGSWLQKRQNRDNIVVATKCRFGQPGKDANATGLSRKNIIKCVEESLRRLQTDYIDLYQIHAWDDAVPLKETLRTLDDLVRAGKVRYVGGSNLTGWQLQKIICLNHSMGSDQWVSLQQQYNLLIRGSEPEAFEVCKREGLGVLPWSPLKGGMLTDKVQREGTIEQGSRMAAQKENLEKNPRIKGTSWDVMQYMEGDSFWTLMDTMDTVAKAHGKTRAQVALRWLLQKEPVTSVIIGAKTLKQLDSNMQASSGWVITEEQMAQLDDASKRKVEYPYDMIGMANADRQRALPAEF